MSYILEKTKGCYNTKNSLKAILLHIAWVSVLITVINQAMECKAVLGGIVFFFSDTYAFIVNVLIVMLTHCPAFLFRRSRAVCNIISVIWLLFGISNFIVTLIRPSPITAIDFVILPTTIDIIPHYLKIWQMILIGVCAICIIVLAYFAVKRSRKILLSTSARIFPLLIVSAVLAVFILGGRLSGNERIDFSDPKRAYDESGVAYAFASTIFDKGIPEPEDYSGGNVEKICQKYIKAKRTPEVLPNIVFVQLESFIDVYNYSEYAFSKDPIPNFHMICERYGEKGLTVPSYGGGTVNTEFEVLTGMSLEYFGAVEYPYNTVLKSRRCEALPRLLEPYGYTSHAVHNHTGVFYGRNKVYPNLGFDTFTPLEYMDYETNELGWAKDICMLPCIKDCIASTPGRDFVFAVSVEGHGLYGADENSENIYGILGQNGSSPDNEKKALLFEDYCKHISETDRFIGELYSYVMSSEEPFLVVLYGDHLPSLEFDTTKYVYHSDYTTQYTVFTNYTDFDKYPKEASLSAGRLSSTVLDYIEIDSGIINMINRNSDSSSYNNDMCEIQYDMLYGDGYSLGFFNLEKTDMTLGIKKVEIIGTEYENGFLTVRGNNFTKASEISINGWSKDTEYFDGSTLKCKCTRPDEGSEITVSQKAVDGSSLGDASVVYD